jgi:hypothetical protein
MKKSSQILVSVILVIILVGISVYVASIFKTKESNPPSVTTTAPAGVILFNNQELVLATDYPSYIIEGPIISINKEASPATIILEARLSRIFVNPPEDSKAVTLKLTDDTLFSIYNSDTQKEAPAKISDFAVGSQIVAEFQEGINSTIMTTESYVSRKVIKMISPATQSF